MAEGFQLIHAFLVFEGIPRKWSSAIESSMPADIANWRERAQTFTDDFEDGETLAI